MTAWISAIGPGELMAICSSVTFALAQTLVRLGMRTGTPASGVFIVNAMACLGGLCISLFRGTLQTSEIAPLLWFAAVGVTGAGVGRVTSYIGIFRMGLSRSVTISSATPIWGTLFAVVILAEAPPTAVIAGTLSIVGGVSLLSLQKGEATAYGSWFRGALIFPLISSLAYALPPIFAKLAYAHQNTPAVGMAVAFATGNIVLLAGRPLLPDKGRFAADGRALVLFFIAGTISIGSSLLLWTAFSVTSVSTALPLSRVAPLWVLLFSYLFLGKLEAITSRVVAATLLVVAGGVLITAFRA